MIHGLKDCRCPTQISSLYSQFSVSCSHAVQIFFAPFFDVIYSLPIWVFHVFPSNPWFPTSHFYFSAVFHSAYSIHVCQNRPSFLFNTVCIRSALIFVAFYGPPYLWPSLSNSGVITFYNSTFRRSKPFSFYQPFWLSMSRERTELC